MNTFAPRHIGYALLGVAVLVGLGFFLGKQSVNAPESPGVVGEEPNGAAPTGESPDTGAPSGTGDTVKPSTGGGAAKPPSSASAPSGLQFATPTGGDVWAINESHPIIWNKEPGTSGGLYLVDEATGKTVGWVVPTTGAAQMSFAWDTRDVSVGRTGGSGVTVQPGMYSLRLAQDGKSSVIASPPFSIVAPGAPQVVTAVVRMKGTKLSPTSLTVVRGAKIVFINNETKAQKVTGNGLAAFTVPANAGMYALNTSSLPPGTYNYITDLYTYQSQGTIVVK